METDHQTFKNILCIRADNMGDVLMTSPSIRALKETFGCNITLLTSSVSVGICNYIEEIDEVITFDLPWVKTNNQTEATEVYRIVEVIKSRKFDAAFIFTVYSQNPLPAAMLAYLAGIPRRIAYCRENPYDLLTDWVPDAEPYSSISHQVRRDLMLVAHLGATTANEKIEIRANREAWEKTNSKLRDWGIETEKPWMILHPGVSEQKREYPISYWIETAKQLAPKFQLLITGGKSEKVLTDKIAQACGMNAFSLGGELTLDEFISLIGNAPLIVSVNTGTTHIAAATGTPVIVLYALTNPQHLPWKVEGRAFYFHVPEHLRSKNEVIKFVNQKYFSVPVPMVSPREIVDAVYDIFDKKDKDTFPELATFTSGETIIG